MPTAFRVVEVPRFADHEGSRVYEGLDFHVRDEEGWTHVITERRDLAERICARLAAESTTEAA